MIHLLRVKPSILFSEGLVVIWMDGPSGGHAQQVLMPLAVAHMLSIRTVPHARDVGIGENRAGVRRELEGRW